MNIQLFAIGTLAAIATADLTQKANVSPGGTSPTRASETIDWVSDTPGASNDVPEEYTGSSATDLEENPVTGRANPRFNSLSDPDSAISPTRLSDVENHWAREFIEALQQRGILQGFPDGTFRPDAPMTRAQFAAAIERAFGDRRLTSAQRLSLHRASFADVPENYWAQTAISAASEMGFLGGYPHQVFQPNQPIPLLQVLIALVKGLNLTPPAGTIGNWDAYFHDPASIPDYAKERLSGAIVLLENLQQHQHRLGLTAPTDWFIHPDRNSTRAEVAAFIYQALTIAEGGQLQLSVASPTDPAAISEAVDEPELESEIGSLFPVATNDRLSSPTPLSEIEENAIDTAESPELSDPSPTQGYFSLQESTWGQGGERSPRDPALMAEIEADRDRYRLDDPDDSVRELAFTRSSRFERSNWEGGDRFLRRIPTDSIPSSREIPTPPSESDLPLETSISLRLDSLRSKMQPTPSSRLDLPPLAAVGTYLPEPGEIFDGYIWPAQGVFTSGFGMRWGRMHKGIDIAAPIGTPIFAAATGVITYARWNSGGYGNLVEIEHPDGSITRYAHNSRILVSEGQQVTQGQLIAELGSTGNSTGPHLHFEIYPPGEDAVDPLAYLPGDRRNLHVNSTVGYVRSEE